MRPLAVIALLGLACATCKANAVSTPAPTVAEPPAPPIATVAPPPPPAPVLGVVSADVEDVAPVSAPYASTTAVCAAWSAETATRAKELAEDATARGLKLGAATCAEAPAGVVLPPHPTYRSVRAFRRSDGLSTYTTLAVELPRGIVVVPLTWDGDDPLDPGCPSITRYERLDAARVENGWLVVTIDGTRSTYNEEDGGSTPESLRGAVWCRDEGAELRCRAYEPQMRPSLSGPFEITATGELVLPPKE